MVSTTQWITTNCIHMYNQYWRWPTPSKTYQGHHSPGSWQLQNSSACFDTLRMASSQMHRCGVASLTQHYVCNISVGGSVNSRMTAWLTHSHCCILFHHVTSPLFIHSVLHGYLGTSQFGAVKNSAAVNILVCEIWCICVCTLMYSEYIPRGEAVFNHYF